MPILLSARSEKITPSYIRLPIASSDDLCRNSNMNTKDHRVGLLTTGEANPPDDDSNDHVGKEEGALGRDDG